MLLIPCPHCGERDESEFEYGGRATVYPALNAGHAQWHEAIHLRESVDGPIEELWFHSAGCECWIRLERDTKSHQFSSGGDEN